MKGQTAKERTGRGAFTQELLRLWREDGIDKMTYKDIVDRITDLLQQNPQVEGTNQSRVIFNSRVAGPNRELFKINMKKVGVYGFVLEAGDAHGVSIDAEFMVYADRNMKQPLGKVVAGNPNAFQTPMQYAPEQEPFTFEGTAYALQTRVGKGADVKLFVELNEKFIDLFIRIKKEMDLNEASKRGITLVDNRESQPDLIVTVNPSNSDLADFEITDATCRQYGLTHMPFQSEIDPKTMYGVVRSAADFYWNLNRSSKQSIIAPKIKFSCFKLVESGEFDDSFEAVLMPDTESGDLNTGGVITIYVDDEADYGFSITNTSAVPLFASLFYFDMSDLSISPYYKPGTAKDGEADVSLPPGGSLTIGYGDSGTAAYNYTLRPNQSIDVGYLKLFLSTAYVDFSNIEQKSPFGGTRASGESKTKVRMIWDSMKIAIVQKKRE